MNVQSSTTAVEAIDCVDCGSDMDLDREGWLNRMYFGRERLSELEKLKQLANEARFVVWGLDHFWFPQSAWQVKLSALTTTCRHLVNTSITQDTLETCAA